MGATSCPLTRETNLRARGAQVGPAEPLGQPTPPGSDSLSNFVFESPQMATSRFHTCQATERKFSHSFGFKMILSFSFLPHLLLDLLALIPSTTLIIPPWPARQSFRSTKLHPHSPSRESPHRQTLPLQSWKSTRRPSTSTRQH